MVGTPHPSDSVYLLLPLLLSVLLRSLVPNSSKGGDPSYPFGLTRGAQTHALSLLVPKLGTQTWQWRLRVT
jgi:hypothetical protein